MLHIFQSGRDVRELSDKKDTLEREIVDRQGHLDKLQGWDSSDRAATEDDVRAKREQVRDMEEQVRLRFLCIFPVNMITHDKDELHSGKQGFCSLVS